MFYKLSNTKDLKLIEETFNSKFLYPKLYLKEKIINGLNENILPIIKTNNQSHINFAIWGLLPDGYKEDWKDFQKLDNTLNIPINTIENRLIAVPNLNAQKCLVIVSGFFSTMLVDGKIYPYYVYQQNQRPFGLAAVYSVLPDGFLTCGILIDESNPDTHNIHNTSNNFPVVMDRFGFNTWIESKGQITSEGIKRIKKPKLQAHPISQQFFKSNIVYKDLLEPVNYDKLPILSLS